ncbi:leucine-rich repeat domain-containing protein [Lapidilactobacillus wuchangensis]|uniref:hypothetical protein n=1 Tax=Lapidilactobacillus wuchangensis TaxID=2486001 RepID=UPI000F783CBC|nr:hypothetical protein [Lapidilactobacillus wuchangensis]
MRRSINLISFVKSALIVLTTLMMLNIGGVRTSFFGSDHVLAATNDYEANLLTDYNIPPTIIQVILDNSLQSDGQTPAAAGKTPSNFTIGDVEKLTTISLAERAKQANGSYTSTTSSIVSDWVKSLLSNNDSANGYSIADGAFKANDDQAGLVTGASGSLTTKTIIIDGAGRHFGFNFLMQIIASARAAKIVDLTGVTSEITDSNTAQFLLSLLQTNRLTALTELKLGSNNLTNLSAYPLANTLFSTTTDQKITKLDLSNNSMTELSWNNSLGDMLATVNTLDLSGNNVQQVFGDLLNALRSVAGNGGSADMSDSELSNDGNTIRNLIDLMNSSPSTITLSNNGVNTLIDQALKLNDPPNTKLVENLAPQLDEDSIKQLLDQGLVSKEAANIIARTHDDLDPDLLARLKEAAGGSFDDVTSQLNVSTALTFAPLDLDVGQTNSTDVLTVSYSLPTNTQLTAAISQWTTTANDSFSGQLTLVFPKQQLSLTNDATILTANTTGKTQTASLATKSVTLAINDVERANITAGATYHNVITWQISNTVTNPQ